ncbi:uncharacterized protein ATNIH1004_006604 [Aspergillus tanneri]|uniref:PNPLA domain-containing protein n=1 Tax=Aspergillus tanneri TaxID=1220188 RepID=A0A5M9MLN3_9EURO|nr:uncharacterized protein ATNIH1004_006604 [Aspergillus tanneri]KAA8647902.1 hypothetical protein ATNIH1004_006604 [Aspergillus tanneri]
MQRTDDIGWLSIGLSERGRFTILDHGRLDHVVSELGDPANQYPALCVYIGAKAKDACLRQLYQYNNIKRHVSAAEVKLRYDMGSLETSRPVLFADGGLEYKSSTSSSMIGCVKTERSISWDSPFIFIITGGDSAADYNSDRSPLERGEEYMEQVEQFHCKLDKNSPETLSECFSAIHFMRLERSHLSECARYERLRVLITGQLDDMYTVRKDHGAIFNATHLVALFRLALQHTAEDICRSFDFVKATREQNEVPVSSSMAIAHYLDIGTKAGVYYEELAPSISSALVMDHYVPGMLALEPRAVFQALYRSVVFDALQITPVNQPYRTIDELAGMVERNMVEQFHKLESTGQSSLEFRREHLRESSGRLCRIRSNKICLVCLLRVAQHRLDCGHAVCDLCAQLFGSPAAGLEYSFTITACLCCLYQRPLVIDVLPPTMNPTILAIDGGGVRGVIPLEFLNLIQENLGLCPLQDLIDLAIGTSSGA